MRETNLILTESSGIPIDRFTWNADSKTLVAEASDLGNTFQITRIWNDACDEGIRINGRRQSQVFFLEKIDKRGGEVTSWNFRPVEPVNVGVDRVVVFND